jgi:hypothetical protein
MYLNSTVFKVFFSVIFIKVNNIELDVVGYINTYTYVYMLMSLSAKMNSQSMLAKVYKAYLVSPKVVFSQAKNMGGLGINEIRSSSVLWETPHIF